MRAGRRLQGLATALTVAMVFAAPAVASASPRWFINGSPPCAHELGGPQLCKQNVVAVGSLTMSNKFAGGEWTCRVLAGLSVGNESEKGVAAIDGWEPFDCAGSGCKGPVYFTPELPPELSEKENPLTKEITYATQRPNPHSNLPWPAETLAGVGTHLNIHKMHLSLLCPSEQFEPVFTGNLEPRVVNGIGNGLHPTHLLFEGKGGNTSWLNGTWLGGKETEETKLFFTGELTILGTSQQLITAN